MEAWRAPSCAVLANLHPSGLDDVRGRFYPKEVALVYHHDGAVSSPLNWERHSDLQDHYVLAKLAQWPNDLYPVVATSPHLAHGHVGVGRRQSAPVPYLGDLVGPRVQESERPWNSRVYRGR